MRSYQTKTFQLKAIDVDTTGKAVKVAIATIGNVDRDGDVFMPEAFTKTISERGPKGTNEVWHLTDHRANLADNALGKFSELYKEGDHIVGVSRYKDSPLWQKVWPLYEAGDINQHSVGFSIIREQKNDTHNEILEVALWEGSAVLWGANPDTPTLGVFKSMTPEQIKDEISDRFKRLSKGIKLAIDQSLLQIEIKQLEQTYIDALESSTLAAHQAPAPQKEVELKLLQELGQMIPKHFKI